MISSSSYYSSSLVPPHRNNNNEGRRSCSITTHQRRHGGGSASENPNTNYAPTTPTTTISSSSSKWRGNRQRQRQRGGTPPSQILPYYCYQKKTTPCPNRTIIIIIIRSILLLFLLWRGFFFYGDEHDEGILLLLGLNDTTTGSRSTKSTTTTTILHYKKKAKTNTSIPSPGEKLWKITTHKVTTYHIPLANTTSRRGWEEIAPYVQHAQEGVLCLGWETETTTPKTLNATTTSTTSHTATKSTPGQVASDYWWTHHPDWGVYNETDEGYCFRPHPDLLQREYLTSVYQHQFFPPASAAAAADDDKESSWCQDPNHVYVTRMWSSGWSADLWNVIHTLQYAWTTMSQPPSNKKIMEIHTNPWHYAAPDQAGRANPGRPSPPACDLLTMYCYFLPLSACTGNPNLPNVTTSSDYDYRRPPLLSNRAKQYLPYYVARPQTWLRHEVYQFVKTQRQQRQASTGIPSTAIPCTVLHVRRGDVVQHGNQSRRYHALEEYLQVLEQKILLRVHDDEDDNNTNTTTTQQPPKKHNLLLLTDDANAILESKEYPQYHWMYIDRPRFQADQGGWEHQLPSSQPILEMTILWATFSFVQQCSHLIYSTSGFSKWLLWVMRQQSRQQGQQGQQRRNRGIQAYNLDDEILITKGQPIFGPHHVHSKNISTLYSSSSHEQQQQNRQPQRQPFP